MGFDWALYVALAAELARRADEASLRSAVSRTYYGAFGAARVWLADHGGGAPAPPGVHDKVWRAFSGRPEKASRRIGQLGWSLHRVQSRADYEAKMPDLARQARDAVAAAERILESLRGL